MDFYAIPPLANLEMMHVGDRYFCLAQLYLTNDEYRDFFNNLPDSAWVTLDNGAGDHDIVTADKLFEVMTELKPNEVIPPDILFDSEQTIHNAISFYQRMRDEGLSESIEIFFCPQGETQEQWINTYRWALNQNWINTIGLSKIAVPYAFLGVKGDRGIMESRHNCFNYLKVHGLLQKPLHLLGMGDPREFEYYTQHDTESMIRSSDSCNSIWSAMNNQSWEEGEFERIPTPKDYFDRVCSDSLLPMNNFQVLKRFGK